MKLYNPETKELLTLDEFKLKFSNTSFPQILTQEHYQEFGFFPVFDTPKPSETATEGEPVLTNKGHYEQSWI